MSDNKFLLDFSAQTPKPVTNQLTPLSGSYKNNVIAGGTPLPVANPVTSKVTSPQPTQVYTNTPAVTPEPPKEEPLPSPEPAPEPVEEEPTPDISVVDEEPEKEDKPKVQKFMRGVVGNVPPGFKAASSCSNCKYNDYDVCIAHNFPLIANYSCDDFELYEHTRVGVQVFNNPPVVEPEVSPLEKAIEEYEETLVTFADSDIADVALSKVVERFTNKSEYATAFLKLRYRRLYEDKHGNLDGAFLNKLEVN